VPHHYTVKRRDYPAELEVPAVAVSVDITHRVTINEGGKQWRA